MAKSQKSYSIRNQEKKSNFNDISFHSIDGHVNHNNTSEDDDFRKSFSIDNDDIIVLDSSEELLYEVKHVLNHLMDDIINQENSLRQIINFPNKRSLNSPNQDKCSLNKKVRFNLPDADDQQQPPALTCLFVSETLQSTNQCKPYAQFLYNLGFDLCLEQNLNENNFLSSQVQKQTLIKYNKTFHQYQIYSCKYCSFQTDSIHVMDRHYQTPHTLSKSFHSHDKYRCTYCLFQTFRLPELRRHLERKHGKILITEPSIRRYSCSCCSYETDDKNHFLKHNNRCQMEQKRIRIENNLLAPFSQYHRNIPTKFAPIKPKPSPSKNNNQPMIEDQIIEPILIELDHDNSSISRSSSSSDEEFMVSSDEVSSSETDNEEDLQLITSRSKKLPQPTSFISHSLTTTASTTLSSLSKLLLLNGTSIPTLNSNKSPLVPIQPKPTTGNGIYQMCNICQCYIYKKDFLKHMNEKHDNQSQQITSTTISNNINTSIIPKSPAQLTSSICLLSTSTMDPQSFTLNMIKCPWCDTNFEHIDIMTGHLMRYHRMTLAVAKVVVAEQMKIQGSSSSQLSLMFKQEIEQIQKEFLDKIYWKISQPKIYLHQVENLSCFICKINIDDIENHFRVSHQMQLSTLNTLKQCCLCGFHCNKKTSSLFEHQLRMHEGVCYSMTLKHFIRFEPPPPPLSKTTIRSVSVPSSAHGRALATYTEKKFGCRKCDTSSHLFTFEELVEHLRLKHNLNVKLHRRCIICQQTYLKGKEYNQHCLEHLNDENPTIKIKRYRKK